MDMQIGGQEYQSGKLDAKRQFHVSRRLAPVFTAMTEVANGDESMSPLLSAISKMSDEDCDYVINACLAVVKRRQNNGWSNVLNAQGGLMFDDIDLPVMLQIVSQVIQENLSGFFAASQPSASGQ